MKVYLSRILCGIKLAPHCDRYKHEKEQTKWFTDDGQFQMKKITTQLDPAVLHVPQLSHTAVSILDTKSASF